MDAGKVCNSGYQCMYVLMYMYIVTVRMYIFTTLITMLNCDTQYTTYCTAVVYTSQNF